MDQAPRFSEGIALLEGGRKQLYLSWIEKEVRPAGSVSSENVKP